MMKTFDHESIHKILGIMMSQVKEEEITHDDILGRFEDIEPLRDK